jgi:hypothetical protein
MMEQKGGPLIGIVSSAKFADPVTDRSIADFEKLRHFLHRLFFDKHRA